MGRGAGWGLTRDSARLHLALRLRTALGGGLSPAEALRTIGHESGWSRPAAMRAHLSLGPAVAAAEDGASLSGALSLANAIEDWERRLLESGERADRLEPALEAWIETLRVRACSRRVLPEVLIYPFTLILVGGWCVAMLSWQVIPTLATILTGAGVEFPLIARWAISSAHWAWKIAPLMLVIVLGLVLSGVIARSGGPVGRFFDRLLFALPVIGPARSALARSIGLEAVAASLDAGDSEAEALRVASQVQSSAGGSQAWDRVAEAAAQGGDLEGPRLLGKRFLRQVAAALTVDDRSDRLRRLARRELSSWWSRAESTVAWFEPLLILGLGLFLAVQLVGWWLAIYSTGSVVTP